MGEFTQVPISEQPPSDAPAERELARRAVARMMPEAESELFDRLGLWPDADEQGPQYLGDVGRLDHTTGVSSRSARIRKADAERMGRRG